MEAQPKPTTRAPPQAPAQARKAASLDGWKPFDITKASDVEFDWRTRSLMYGACAQELSQLVMVQEEIARAGRRISRREAKQATDEAQQEFLSCMLSFMVPKPITDEKTFRSTMDEFKKKQEKVKEPGSLMFQELVRPLSLAPAAPKDESEVDFKARLAKVQSDICGKYRVMYNACRTAKARDQGNYNIDCFTEKYKFDTCTEYGMCAEKIRECMKGGKNISECLEEDEGVAKCMEYNADKVFTEEGKLDELDADFKKLESQVQQSNIDLDKMNQEEAVSMLQKLEKDQCMPESTALQSCFENVVTSAKCENLNGRLGLCISANACAAAFKKCLSNGGTMLSCTNNPPQELKNCLSKLNDVMEAVAEAQEEEEEDDEFEDEYDEDEDDEDDYEDERYARRGRRGAPPRRGGRERGPPRRGGRRGRYEEDEYDEYDDY